MHPHPTKLQIDVRDGQRGRLAEPQTGETQQQDKCTVLAWLADLKITAAGRNTPGMLIPLLRVDGSTWGYQYKPDMPRLRDGKPIKYETPFQQRNGLDIPPGVNGQLGDPAVPLFITEGVKKADCGALHGLCIVDLIGVWNWLCTNTAWRRRLCPLP